jgi:hypothetical protein
MYPVKEVEAGWQRTEGNSYELVNKYSIFELCKFPNLEYVVVFMTVMGFKQLAVCDNKLTLDDNVQHLGYQAL